MRGSLCGETFCDCPKVFVEVSYVFGCLKDARRDSATVATRASHGEHQSKREASSVCVDRGASVARARFESSRALIGVKTIFVLSLRSSEASRSEPAWFADGFPAR